MINETNNQLNMIKYKNQPHSLVAVDCIIFGFDGEDLKILLVKRGLEPEIGKWSLMGGFVSSNESLNAAANRVLKTTTGLEDMYLEQLFAYGEPDRDPIERTFSVAYFSLIDLKKYKHQITNDHHAEWFLINDMPKLIFDHGQMVEDARNRLRYKAAQHPILFELLPKQFTMSQIHKLFEAVNNISIDQANFARKMTSTGLLIKLNEKDKASSKRGAFYFKLDKKRYQANLNTFLNLMPGLK